METLLGVIIGAILAGAGKLLFDFYERTQDRNGIASAIAGEISGIIYGVEVGRQAQAWANLAITLRSANPLPPPWAFHDPSAKTNPVLDAYIGRIGALGGSLPERVANFYTLQAMVRLKVKMMASGIWNNNPQLAAVHIDEGLAIWATAVKDGKPLIDDLKALAGS